MEKWKRLAIQVVAVPAESVQDFLRPLSCRVTLAQGMQGLLASLEL